LRDRQVEPPAVHGDSAIRDVPQTRTRLCFHESRVRQKFSVQANVGISPSSGRCAMKNMQLIGPVELRLRFIVGNDVA
jgi:hypothetical protein